MKILIGLGNPGEKYKKNRHNAGQMFVDYIINELVSSPTTNASASAGKRINEFRLIKTDCFMNQSGNFVKKLIKNFKFKIKNLIVVHDDLDIPLGKFKIQKGVGPKLHNGLDSIEQNLGTKDFWRVRIGVDNRKPDEWVDGETYVLQDFHSSEKNLLYNDVFSKILPRLQAIILKIDNRVIV